MTIGTKMKELHSSIFLNFPHFNPKKTQNFLKKVTIINRITNKINYPHHKTLIQAPLKVSGSIPSDAKFRWAKSIRSYALVLNGAPASGRWDWSPRNSRFLNLIPSLKKK